MKEPFGIFSFVVPGISGNSKVHSLNSPEAEIYIRIIKQVTVMYYV